jgi:hypothetical protein
MPASKYIKIKIKPSSRSPLPTYTITEHTYAITKQNARGIKSIGANDILFGRGKKSDKNKGNIKFRNYCNSMREQYASLSKVEKTKLTHTKFCKP